MGSPDPHAVAPHVHFIPPAFRRRAQAYAMPGHEAVERDSAPAAMAGQFVGHPAGHQSYLQ